MYVYVYSNIECLCALLIKGVYVCVVQSLACFWEHFPVYKDAYMHTCIYVYALS